MKGTIQGLIDRQNQGLDFLRTLGIIRAAVEERATHGPCIYMARCERQVLDQLTLEARRIYGDEYVFEAMQETAEARA